MGEEGGRVVPLHYGSPLQEAAAARAGGAIGDLSHAGRIRLRGSGALSLLEKICTADVVRQEDDTGAVTLLCNQRGGVIDICYLLRFDDSWTLTCSPGNADRIVQHARAADTGGTTIDDLSASTCQFAVTGTGAEEILGRRLPIDIAGLPRGAARSGSLMIARYTAARIGPVPSWSLEVILPEMFAGKAWDHVTDAAGGGMLTPCGTIARDILRLEHGLPRWGCELNETVDPVAAGLEYLLREEGGYIGAAAIAAIGTSPPRRRVSLACALPRDGDPAAVRLPPSGSPLTGDDGRELGTLTSAAAGTDGAGLVAQGYVSSDRAAAGTGVVLADLPGRPRGTITRVFGGRQE